MAKCGVVGCQKAAIAGFIEIKKAGTFDNPKATQLGHVYRFCSPHEVDIRPKTVGLRGRWLTLEELDMTEFF